MKEEPFIEDPHPAVDLQFVMNGPIFDEGLPLPLTIKSLEAIQGIADKSYLVLANKRRMSAQERNLFYLQSQGIQRGSLIAAMGLVFTAVQPALPIVSNLGPTGVWEYAKHSFQFLKLVFEAKKKGAAVTITQSGNGSSFIANAGTQTFHIANSVFHIANNSLPHYEYLANQLDKSRVTDIRLGVDRQKDIFLDLSDKTLFDLPTKVGEEIHRINGELYEFDKYSSTGRIKVFERETLSPGEYKFTVIGRQDVAEYIEAMLEKNVLIRCLEETVEHPLRGTVIASLQVLNVSAQ